MLDLPRNRAALPEEEREMLCTGGLTLIPLAAELKFAFQLSPVLMASMLGVTLPESWPQFQKAFALRPNGESRNWGGFLFVLGRTVQLIGNGGYVAPPDAAGNVEIGYEVAPAFRDQGFATEAAKALVERAFQHGARSVSVTTLAGANASNAIAYKLGMRFTGDEFRDDVGMVWHYGIWREQAEVADERVVA